MLFEKDYIYHLFNQGNNRQPIFYSSENYLFFLKKIKSHVIPFADLLAWCLMPNHFHLMIYVNSVEIKKSHA
jgi:putative transposase